MGHATKFVEWLKANGAELDERVKVNEVLTEDDVHAGVKVLAADAIPPDTTVVSIPFSLAITPDVARVSLRRILNADLPESWSERQLIASYVTMHWILPRGEGGSTYLDALRHRPYVDALPHRRTLRTPLHFTDAELACFRGTNLFGATADRRKAWTTEWEQCAAFVKSTSLPTAVKDAFTWEDYLAASTHLSSRAFPSTVLSSTPSLQPDPSSYPVLLPGIDALNHERASRVSWVVSSDKDATIDNPSKKSLRIALLLHSASPAGTELTNNYGPKPNAELVLGYGFALSHNPDDTIVLKIGGSPSLASSSSAASTGGKRWEVGRGAAGVDGVWGEVRAAVAGSMQVDGEEAEEVDEEEELEIDLNTADTLQAMVQSLIDRLPNLEDAPSDGSVRPEVRTMLEFYVEGQRDILQSISAFARAKIENVLHRASEAGIDLGVEENDDESEGADMMTIEEDEEEDSAQDL